MLLVLIVISVVVSLALATVRRRRRRPAPTMIVTTVPGIELEQAYGGWNADAYDSRTGHGAPPVRLTWHSGPPSTWARLP